MREVFVHQQALCESDAIGPGTRIWAFAHVLAGAQVGGDCNISDGVFIEGGATVGDRVTVECGVQLWSSVTLSDDVHVGANATFGPSSSAHGDHSGHGGPGEPGEPGEREQPRTIVHKGASIGANATIVAGVEIGRGATVSPGAVVTRSVPPNAIVVGNPAHITGYTYTQTPETDAQAQAPISREPGTFELDVRGVCLQRFAEFSDLRGSLTAGELPSESIPFAPRRWFLVYDVPSREVRGEHAHRLCHQFLVCVSGSMTIAVDDGEHRQEVTLDNPTLGLHIPPLVWASQFRYNPDTVLLVLASHFYDPSDYIRDYEVFLTASAQKA